MQKAALRVGAAAPAGELGMWRVAHRTHPSPGNLLLQLAKMDQGSWEDSLQARPVWVFNIDVQVRGEFTVSSLQDHGQLHCPVCGPSILYSSGETW